MDAPEGAVGVARRRGCCGPGRSACAWLSGWLARKALSFSGSGLPVAGSGRMACIRSRKVCGVAAPKYRRVQHRHVVQLPFRQLEGQRHAAPAAGGIGRLGVAAGQRRSGRPPAPACRRTAPSANTPQPRACRRTGRGPQVPLVWLRRSPGVTPKAPSIASTTSGADTSPAARACGEIRSTPAAMAGAVSRTGFNFSFIFIFPVWGVV